MPAAALIVKGIAMKTKLILMVTSDGDIRLMPVAGYITPSMSIIVEGGELFKARHGGFNICTSESVSYLARSPISKIAVAA